MQTSLIVAGAAGAGTYIGIQKFHPERMIPGGTYVQNGVLVGGGVALIWGGGKVNGVAGAAMVGAGAGAATAGVLAFFGL